MPIVLTGGTAMLPGKQHRQSHIADILAHHAVASQEDLVALLRGRGIEARQSTVSRDIKEMGVIRRAEGGSYRYCLPGAAPAAPAPSLAEVLARHLLRVDGNEFLLVLHTPPGAAHLVASSIDRAGLPGVAGTVAGDDTLLVVPRTRADRRRLEAFFAHPKAAGSA